MRVADTELLETHEGPGRPWERLAVSRRTGTADDDWFAITVEDPAMLADLAPLWSALAQDCAEPNSFYEPWFLLPAIKHLGAGKDWKFVLVGQTARQPGKPPELHGFFPFIKYRSRLGSTRYALWKHPYCFLTNPLIRRGVERDVFRTLMTSLRDDASCLEFPLICGEGPLQQALVDTQRETLTASYLSDQYARAFLVVPKDPEAFLKASLGGHHLREYRRQRRKLDALGQIEFRRLQDVSAVGIWTDWFLNLEATGWKARAGTAIQQNAAHAQFFREIARQGFSQGKLDFCGLFLNGEPIALKCNLWCPPGSLAFKIAYDESLNKFSPGVQLEMEYVSRMSDAPQLQWCDSCAAPGHLMIDRLWTERRIIQHALVSTGRWTSELELSALPLLRSLRRISKRILTPRDSAASRDASAQP